MALTNDRPRRIAYKVLAQYGNVTVKGPVRTPQDKEIIKAEATDMPTKRRAKAKRKAKR